MESTFIKEKIRKGVESAHALIQRETKADVQSWIEAGAGIGYIKIMEAAIISKYQGLIAYVRQSYQAATQAAQDKYDTERRQQSDMDADADIDEAKETKRIAMTERRRLFMDYDWAGYPLKLAMEGVMLFSEVAFNDYSFAPVAGSILLAVLPSVAVSVATLAIAIRVGSALRDKPYEQMKTIVKYGSIMFVAFISLALLRTLVTATEGGFSFTTGEIVIAAAYVAINLLIFSGAVIIASGMPTGQDRITKRTYDELTRKIEAADKRIAKGREGKKAEGASYDMRRKERITLAGEQSHLEGTIQNFCQQTLTVFYAELALYKPSIKLERTDISQSFFSNNQKSQS